MADNVSWLKELPVTLSRATLDRGITLLGNAHAIHPLFSELHAGRPIVLGVFGASVAQNAGCLAQPFKRCMAYSGLVNLTMKYGWPLQRPVKGFAVQLYDHIQTRFPHKDHQINNSALDATPIQVALPCLFSHVPLKMHLVLLDFGSMALHLDFSAIEGVVRALLSLKPRPALVLVSVHEWCTQRRTPRALYRVGQLLTGTSTKDMVYPDTPWLRAELECQRVCMHYGQACISIKTALEPHAYAGERGFALFDLVGDDCLHPINGRFGVSYISQILSHWFDVANASWHAQQNRAWLLRQKPLPPPLYPNNNRHTKPRRCFAFKDGPGGGQQTHQGVAWCSVGRHSQLQANQTCFEEPPKYCPRHLFSTDAKGAADMQKFLSFPPRFWFFCRFSLSNTNVKISPGVVGLAPGATLLARIDIAMTTLPHEDPSRRTHKAVAHVDGNHLAPVILWLEYLVSYMGMGIAKVSCRAGCGCTPQRIDAHQLGDVRNVSIFTQHAFNVTPIAGHAPIHQTILKHECVLEIRISRQSSSGGHKFKVRSITVGST